MTRIAPSIAQLASWRQVLPRTELREPGDTRRGLKRVLGQAVRLEGTDPVSAELAVQSIEHEAYRRAGKLVTKRWNTVGDGRVRRTHRLANRQVRLVDEPFSVGGFNLRYQRDPSAPLHETIGCRCWRPTN